MSKINDNLRAEFFGPAHPGDLFVIEFTRHDKNTGDLLHGQMEH